MNTLERMMKDLEVVLDRYNGRVISGSITYNGLNSASVTIEAEIYPQAEQKTVTPAEREYEIVRRERSK